MRLGWGEMALDVEDVIDGGMRWQEFLSWAPTPEPLHLALPPSGRLMRILGTVVLPPPALVAVLDPKILDRGAVWPQIVGDQSLRDEGIFLQELAHQLQRVLISLGLDQRIEDLAFASTARQR
jgi:hypothetical protein